MRWTVLALILANIGYFAWGMYRQSQLDYAMERRVDPLQEESGRRLILLSEALLKEKAVAPKLMMAASQASEDSKFNSKDACLLLGPFRKPEKADQLQQRLFSMGVSSKERSDMGTDSAGYWVHIPPLPGRDAAIRMLRELQAQKIDSFVITQGELSNGISLGLFNKEASANTVSRRLMEAGYNVSIKTLPRTPELWWLELDVSEEGKLNQSFWNETARQFPDLKKIKKNCKSIASNDEFQ